MEAVSGVILAGGKSSRMGRDKALLTWKGERLTDRMARIMDPACSELLVSTHLSAEHFGNLTVIRDRFEAIGPIAGLESGLFHAAHALVLFASVDSPNLSADLFRYLVEKHRDYDISLAAHLGVDEPMIGIYSRSLHPQLESFIRSGQTKPPAFIRQQRWQMIEIHPGLPFYEPDLFKNVNSPNDLI